jgi:hypothetical protein
MHIHNVLRFKDNTQNFHKLPNENQITWLCNIYHATSVCHIQVLLSQNNFLCHFYFWMLHKCYVSVR